MGKTTKRKPYSSHWQILTFIIFSILYSYLALNRLIAKDEGFYVMAAKLVAHGQSPYLDFFYPQMPLLPYLYAIGIKLFGSSWDLMRIVSAMLTAITTTLLYNLMQKNTNWLWAGLSIVCFAFCNFIIPWHLSVQTYALSCCLLFASYYVYQTTQTQTGLLVVGILFGFSVCTRLFFAGLLPIYLILLWKDYRSTKALLKSCIVLGLGILLGLLPAIYFFCIDPELFYFNNLGYHLHRSSHTSEQIYNNKIRVLQVILGLHDSVKFDALHLPILIWLTIAFAVVSFWKKIKIEAALLFVLGLSVLNFTPSPTYVQYFCTLIPFLFLVVTNSLFNIHNSLTDKKKRYLLYPCYLLLLVTYFCNTLTDIERYTKTGTGVIGIRNEENAKLWNLEQVKKVSSMINRNLEPNTQVISLWPGYLFDTHTKPLPGLENHFSPKIAPKLALEQRSKKKLITLKQVSDQILSKNTTYVLDNQQASKRHFRKAIQSRKCSTIDQESVFTIYKCESLLDG